MMIPGSFLDFLGKLLGLGGRGGSSNAVPEFDGPAGIAAIVLAVSVGVVLYNRWRE